MNSSLNLSSSAITSMTPPATRGISISPVTQASYSTVSVIGILGNTMTILIFISDKMLLKKSYNILILTLAIADVLTSVQLITSPTFVLGDMFPIPTDPFLAEIFCRVIWSRVFLFQLVVFSAYIVLVLTTERWFAVVKPYKYKDVFNQRRVICYIIFSWVWSFCLTCGGLFEIRYSSSPDKICEFQFYLPGSFFRVFTSVFQVSMKMIFPCLVIIGLYIHMVVKTSKSNVSTAESKAKLRGKMTRMIGAVGFIVIICFTPNQIYLVFAQAGKAKLDTTTHHFLSLLVFVNSCVNPLVYGLSNTNYRQRYRRLLFAICPGVLRYPRVTPEAPQLGTQDGANAGNAYSARRSQRVQPSTKTEQDFK